MENQIAPFIIQFVVFIFSATFHEAAHAWAAYKLGDPTAYHGGQVSLNPLPHIQREPVGMVVIPIVAFFISGFVIGWASVPLDPYWAERNPHKAAKVSWAGPLANLALLVVFSIIFVIMLRMGADYNPSIVDLKQACTYFVGVMVSMNLLLMVLNLIPLPPLDGSGAILLFFKEDRAREIRYKMQTLGFFGFIIAFLIFNRIMPYIEAGFSIILAFLVAI